MSKLIIALLGIGWLVLFAMGVRDDADNFFTPAQVLAGEVHKNIPFWVGGTPAEVEVLDNGISRFQLSGTQNTVFVKSAHALPNQAGEVLVLVKLPPCSPATTECPFEARAVLPMHSLLKYFHMGSYGLYVWIAYGLALVILIINFVLPRQQEAEIKRALARKLRRVEK